MFVWHVNIYYPSFAIHEFLAKFIGQWKCIGNVMILREMEKFIIWYSIVPISRCMFITLSYTHILLYSMFWYLGLIFDNHCLIHFKCTWRNQLPCLFSLAMPKRTNNWTWKCTKITRANIVNDIIYFDINLYSPITRILYQYMKWC